MGRLEGIIDVPYCHCDVVLSQLVLAWSLWRRGVILLWLVSLACAMVERRLREVVIVGGSGDKAEVGGCSGWWWWLRWKWVCLLIFLHPSKTHDTRVMGVGFTGVQKCQPIPVPIPTCDLNPYGFVNL